MQKRSNLDSWIAHTLDGGILPERDIQILCEKVKEILIDESNVVHVSAPVNVCGDLHGSFVSLEHVLESGGQVPNSRYIFMGNFVNRGRRSCETL